MKSGVLYLRTYYPFFILSVSTILIFTRFALISFLAFIFILAITTSRVRSSWPRQIVWVYLSYFCLLTVISAIGWLADIRITPDLVLLFLAAVSWFAVLRLPKNNKDQPEQKVNRSSWLGFAVALAVSVYVSIPIIMSFSPETVLRYAAKTGDDINHIVRVEAIRNTGGLLYQQKTVGGQLIDPGTAASPQGWHYNGAFFESLIIRLLGPDKIDFRLLSYLLYKTLWLFLAVYLLYELQKIIAVTYFRLSEPFYNLLSALGVGIISALLLVSVFGFGFQNLIASIALLCASLIIAIKYFEDKNSTRKHLYIFGLILLTATSIYVWTLAGAIVGLVALAVLVREFLVKYKMTLAWWQWLSAVGLGILAILPLYFLVDPASQRGIKTINNGGAVPPISVMAVAVLILVTLLVIGKLGGKKSSWLVIILALASTEFFALATYQQSVVGEQRYYLIKIAFLVSSIITVTFFAVVAKLLYLFSPSKTLIVLPYLGVLILLPLVLGIDFKKSAYPLKDSAPIKTSTARKILKLQPQDGSQKTIIYASGKEEVYLANKLWSDVNLYTGAERKYLLEKLNSEINN